MSDTKKEQKPRTIAEIHQEYQNGCLKAGQIQYQIDAMSKDLTLLNSTLRDLNFEAASLQAKLAAEAVEKAKASDSAQSQNQTQPQTPAAVAQGA